MKTLIIWRTFDSVKQLDAPQLAKAHAWYETAGTLFKENFGEEWFWCATGWALTQSDGLGWVDGLKLVRTLAGASTPSSHRDDTKSQVLKVLKHKPSPRVLADAFILDFGDAILGKSVRTIMGDDVRGGAPAPIDIWGYRDHGFVDSEYKEYLRMRFGDEQTKVLKLDKVGEDQYEYAVRTYNHLADELNAIRFGGLKWAPHNVHAVGRLVLQRQMAVTTVFPEQIFAEAGLRAGA
jgi:hypothetical protein